MDLMDTARYLRTSDWKDIVRVSGVNKVTCELLTPVWLFLSAHSFSGFPLMHRILNHLAMTRAVNNQGRSTKDSACCVFFSTDSHLYWEFNTHDSTVPILSKSFGYNYFLFGHKNFHSTATPHDYVEGPV